MSTPAAMRFAGKRATGFWSIGRRTWRGGLPLFAEDRVRLLTVCLRCMAAAAYRWLCRCRQLSFMLPAGRPGPPGDETPHGGGRGEAGHAADGDAGGQPGDGGHAGQDERADALAGV